MDLISSITGRPLKSIVSFITLAFLLIFSGVEQSAGQVVHQAVSTAGSNAAGAGGSVSYTAGQVFYITKPGAPGNVAEGIQNCVVNCDPSFSGSTSVTNVLCFGAATGIVDLSVTGGYGPFTFLWSNGATTEDLNGVVAGTYTVIIRDSRGCITRSGGTITQPTELVLSTTQTDVLCNGDASGSATVSHIGGVGPFTYSWNSAPVQLTATATGLPAGTYTVTVTDANTCIKTINVTITEPALLTIATSQVNIACFGEATGSATATPSGGALPYSYSWDTSPVQTSQTASGLIAGTYTVTVTDANLCTETATVTLTEPASALSLSTSQTNVFCFGGSTGTATVTPSGGTAGYTYSWDSTPVQTTQTATGLAAGTYTVTVTDANLCNETATVTITQPATGMSGAISAQTNVLCFGNSTGDVTIAGAGGTPPYEYSLDGGAYQLSGYFNGLAAGSYIVTVRDANLVCTYDVPVTITQPAAALSVSTSQVNVLCFGNSTGTATANPAGGTAGYTYSWDTTPVQTTQTATGLAAGTYTVTVTDANFCTETASVTITQPADLTVTTSQVNVLCFGNATGTATANPAGGAGGYTYSWDTTPVQTTQTATGLIAGTYIVTVTDANLCTETATVTITQPAAALSITTSQVNVLCFGNSTGTATANPAGGAGGYTYSWDTTPVQNTQTATGLAAGTYIVAVTDANLCTETASVTITQPAAALSITTSQVNVLCFGNSTGTATANPAGGTAGYTYSWDTTPVQTTQTATGLIAGTYTVTVTDANLCTGTASVTITQPADLTVTTSQVNVLCFGNATGTATANPAGGAGGYTYSWDTTPVQTTQTATGLIAGTYTVTVTDANLCTETATVTITQPAAALSVTTTQVNVLCFGNSTGTATANPAGGTTGYTYSWDTTPVQTTQTATGLAAGTYTVTVTDANLCTETANVTITQPADLTVTTSQVNVLCFGNSTGTATANPGGGAGGYTYSWNTTPAQTTQTATGLAAGTYTVTVTDASLCTETATVTITQPADLTVTTSQVNVLCFGNATGTATANPAGGAGGYTYSWDTTPVQTTQTATGLIAGTYTVTVTDANLCTETATVTITQPAAVLSVTTTQVNVLCFGNATGTATANPSGGTAGYTYSWDTTPVQTTQTATGLAAGTYTVTVTDANLCTETATVTITQPAAAISITTSQVNVLCFGNNTGNATANPAGGTGAFTYSWDTTPVQTTQTATGLTAGTYTVTVTDANLCTETASVTITEPADLTVGTSQVNVLCFGNATGTATANPAGGAGGYTYSWDTTPVQTTQTATGLAAGTYTVTVTDANLCTETASVTITQPAAVLSVTATQVNVLCFGNSTGTVTANPAGGTAGYTYSWDTTPVQTTQTATGLPAGTYTVTVTDANLCTSTASVTITQPAAALTLTSSKVDVLCFGNSTGSATVNPAGGTLPYGYSWNTTPVQTTQTATGLPAGIYIVTVTDANGCIETESVTINQPATGMSGTITAQTNVSCFGNSSGSVTVDGAGGTAPYEYSLNGGAYQASGTFSSLSAGSYTVTVRDATLTCTFDVPVTITSPAAILAVVTTQTNVLCFGELTGSATAIPSDGTAPYTYSWNTAPVQTTPTATGLGAGLYTVTITDANSCAATANVNIGQPVAALTLNPSQVNVACNGDATGSASVNVTGGTGSYTYSWDTTPVETTASVSGLAAGTYTVTVTDDNSCVATETFIITEPAAPLSTTSTQTDVLCFGNSTGSATANPAGGTAPYTYLWDTTPVQTTQTINGLPAGMYTVIVTDANLCTVTISVTITEPAAALSVATTQTDVLCFGNSTGTATANPSGGTAGYTYSWDTTPAQTTQTATGLTAGTYTVTVTDANLCTETATVTITEPAAALTVNTSQTDVLCTGNATGTATANPSGGIAPYSYSWDSSPVQTSQVATGLTAGTYTVTVTDANSCTQTASVTLTEPAAALLITTSQVNVRCYGDATGSATATVSGGTGAYTYSWNTTPAQTTATATGLIAAAYTVTVTDANNCIATENVIVTQPADPLTVTTTQVDAGCFGATSGSATATPAGGTLPYAYSWDTTPVQTTATATGLGIGTYTVTITDGAACVTTASVNILQPGAPLSVTATKTDAGCFGEASGTATAVPAGGTGPYTYSWDTTPVQTSVTASGLTAGTYNVTVTDANSCTATTSITLSEPASALSVTTTQVDVLCFGNSTGSATAVPAGGTAPYTYSWNTTPVQTGITATGLAAGSYTLTVTDANSCTSTATVTITQPATGMTGSVASQTNVLCFGNSTGSVSVTGAGGTAPYEYSLDAGPFQVSGTFSSLAAGTYTVTVRDATLSCTFDVPVVITQPAAALASGTTKTDVACFGDASGSATAVPSGGTAPYTYSWNTTPVQTSITATSLATGTYTVTVTDANSCQTTASATISQPAAALAATTSQTGASCFGASSGSASVVASGGTGPYTYAWSTTPVQTTSTATGLAAGSYTVTVTDANSCQVIESITVTQPAGALSVLTSQVNVGCFGGATGSATATPSGGTGPYTYSWNTVPVQTTPTATGLTAGPYTVTVTDANICTESIVVTITQPAAALAVSISGVDVSCFGGSTGSATATPSGGTGPYTYSWDTTPVQSGITATGLATGSYTVTVTDANSCTASGSIAISQPAAPLSVSTTQVDILCFGNSTGSATAVPAGGTGPYTYSWSTSPAQTTATITALSAGPYTVTVTDSKSCIAASTAIINEPAAALSVSTTQTNVLCFGGSTGTATVTPSGGTGPYTYSWNTTPSQSTATASGLSAGPYTVTVTDANSCPTTASVTISQPATGISGLVAAQTNVLCHGNSTGSVTVTGSGGTPPYEFSLNGGTYQASGTFASLSAGTYTVTLRDATLSCTFDVPVTISEPAAPLSLTTSQVDAACFGGNSGSATVVASGGTAPYVYSWNTTPVQTAATATGLSAGTIYIVTVTDANNCTSTANVTLTQPAAPLSGVATSTAVGCFGDATGSATVTSSGGTAPYFYSWNSTPVQTTSLATGLAAGTYIVTITDVNSCSTTVSVTVSQPASALSGSITSKTDPSTIGGSNGSVTVAGAGGTAPYQYSLNSGTFQVSGTFVSLSAGAYNVTVQDANLCTFTVPVTIADPLSDVEAAITAQTNVLCFGNTTGSVTVTASKGVPPYEYRLDAGPYQASGTFSSIAAGTYTVTARDATLTTVIVPVTITEPVAALGGSVVSRTNVLCFGESTGSMTVTGLYGTAPYEYKLGTGSFQSSGTFTSVPAGAHTITIQDANLCTYTMTVTIVQPAAALSGAITNQTNITCYGAANGIVTITGSGGTSPYQYSLNSGTYQISGTFGSLTPGAHTVSIRDANLCTFSVAVMITEPAALALSASSVEASCPGVYDGSIELTITGGTQPYSATWSDGVTTVNRVNIPDGTYSVVVTDKNSCAAALDVVVGVVGSSQCLEFPEVITPNNDGFLDTWQIKNADLFPNAEIQIFTRWGKRVYSSKNLAGNPWDGTDNGKLLPTDSYHYILYLNDGSPARSGVVTIIR